MIQIAIAIALLGLCLGGVLFWRRRAAAAGRRRDRDERQRRSLADNDAWERMLQERRARVRGDEG